MQPTTTRRTFLRTATTTAVLGEWGSLLSLSPLRAGDAVLTPDLVRFGPDLEPVVRLIEETSRERCPSMMIEQLRRGLPYRNFVAALFLANVRTLGMGHPLVAVHAANQLALDVPVQERLLPMFWALDSFKYHQERGREGPFLRRLVGDLPTGEQAEAELHAGMREYDRERVERAAVVLARTQGAARAMEPFWHYGARDWSFIGHLAIWVSHTWGLLNTIGWRHAETALRSLGPSILGNRAGLASQSYAANQERVRTTVGALPSGWPNGRADEALTRELLALIRTMQREDACRLALDRLRAGTGAAAIWDAVHLAAGEIYLNQPWDGGTSLHANTGVGALHDAFLASGEPANRLLILLQAVAWTCLYRGTVANGLRAGHIPVEKVLTDLTAADISANAAEAADDVLSVRSADPELAARKALAFARRFPDSGALTRAACRLLPLKASWDPHDVKFPVAMMEKQHRVSAVWRPYLLAATALSFKGSAERDMPVVHRVREALRTL